MVSIAPTILTPDPTLLLPFFFFFWFNVYKRENSPPWVGWCRKQPIKDGPMVIVTKGILGIFWQYNGQVPLEPPIWPVASLLQRDLHSMRVGTWDRFTHEKEGVWAFGGSVSNAKFQCLGMSWGCCDNGWRRGREWVEGEAKSGNCAGEREREKKNLFYESLLKLARNSGRVMKIFKGKIVFLLFGEVSKI